MENGKLQCSGKHNIVKKSVEKHKTFRGTTKLSMVLILYGKKY